MRPIAALLQPSIHGLTSALLGVVWTGFIFANSALAGPLRSDLEQGVIRSNETATLSVDAFIQRQQSARQTAISEFTRAIENSNSADRLDAVRALRQTLGRLAEEQPPELPARRQDRSTELAQVRAGMLSGAAMRSWAQADRMIAELGEISKSANEPDRRVSPVVVEWFKQNADRLRRLQRQVAEELEATSDLKGRPEATHVQLPELFLPPGIEPDLKRAIERRRQTIQALIEIQERTRGQSSHSRSAALAEWIAEQEPEFGLETTIPPRTSTNRSDR